MTPPELIRIGYADFPIRVVEAINEQDDMGESSWSEQYIKICSGLSHQHKAQVLMHEVEHMMWAYADLKEGDDEERIVTVLSNIRAQVYRDNPAFLKYLVSVFGATSHVRS
jgi:hypothetical protein